MYHCGRQGAEFLHSALRSDGAIKHKNSINLIFLKKHDQPIRGNPFQVSQAITKMIPKLNCANSLGESHLESGVTVPGMFHSDITAKAF